MPADETSPPAQEPRPSGLNADALARAEAALKSLSSQFALWLQDELSKLEAARAALHADGMTQVGADRLYGHAHDLKGLGTTYEYPLITRMAGSLCRLLEEAEGGRLCAPLTLIDAHVDAIVRIVREEIRDPADAKGLALAQDLEAQVAQGA